MKTAKKFFRWLRTRDSFGDSPLALATCALVWILTVSALLHMPGY